MKKLLLILSIISTAKVCFGQQPDQKVIVQLYSKTIENYFNQLALQAAKANRLDVKPQFILIGDSVTAEIPTIYPNFTLKILKDQNDGIREVEKLPNKKGMVNVISKKINIDTLDISINNWIVSVKRTFEIHDWQLVTKHVHLLVNCGGTLGYIPTGRMVYSAQSKVWNYMSGEEILAEKRKRNPYL